MHEILTNALSVCLGILMAMIIWDEKDRIITRIIIKRHDETADERLREANKRWEESWEREWAQEDDDDDEY